MRVTHFGYSDLLPGASRASYRLHRALLDRGVDSRMVVAAGLSGDREVVTPAGWRRAATRLASRADALATRALLPPSGERSAAFFGSGLVEWVAASSPDVVQLHWIAGGLARPPALRKLAGFPVVWRLPDEWPMHGSSHYAASDSGALDRYLLSRKQRAIRALDRLTVVTPSNWLARTARDSAVFEDRRIEVIATGLDLGVWKPTDRREARRSLGLDPERPVVLFGASGGDANPRKGWDLMLAATFRLDTGLELVAFGGGAAASPGVRQFGAVREETTLRSLYAAADVMVVPSRQENLPNSGIEALACGTPVVGFDIGGMPDLVEHGVSGWLAEPFEADGLAAGVDWALHSDRRSAARERAERCFDVTQSAGQYIRLYTELAG